MKLSASRKRKLLFVIFILLLLPVLLVGLAVQPFFITSVILPRVEKATDSQIEIGSLAFSPFSKLVVEDVVYRKNDQSMIAELQSLTLSYNLIKSLKGTITVEELRLNQPNITYRMLEAESATLTPKISESGLAKELPVFDIKNVKIENGSFTFIQEEQTLQVTDVSFKLPAFVTGESLNPSFTASLLSTSAETSTRSALNGTLEADFEVGLDKDLLPSSLKGQLTAAVESSNSGLPKALSIDLKTDLEMNLEDRLFSIRELSILALQADRDLIRLEVKQPTEINLSGSIPSFTDTEITLNIPKVNLQDLPFSEFFPTLSGTIYANGDVSITRSGKAAVAKLDVDLENLFLKNASGENAIQATKLLGQASLNWVEGQTSKLQLQLNANQVMLPGKKKVPSPLQVRLDLEASPTRGDIKAFSLSWSETPDFENRIQVEGFADWADVKALKADLKVRASTLDLKPWSSFLVQTEAATPEQDSPSEASSDTRIELSSWPLDSIKADVEIEGIKLEKILLERIKLNLSAGAEQLSIQPASLVVNGSTLATDLELSWKEGPVVFATSSSLSPLDLEPIFDTLLPTKLGAITGVVQGQTTFTTQGQNLEELWEALNGSIDFAYTEGKLRLIDPDPDQNTGLFHTRKLVQNLITALANSLKLSPDTLMAPDIEAVLFQARITDQLLSINKAKVLNPEFLMEASGVIRLSTQVEQSRIENLPVVMGVNTNLAKRVKIYRENRVQGDYVVLPSFVAVSGTLAEPKIDVKESVITGLVLTGVTERNEIGNEDLQTALDVLGSLLTGEPIPNKPAPTEKPAPPGSTPTPTPEPSKSDQIVEGLRFLQKLRATPTPTP